MIFIAWKNLLHDRIRLLLSVLGISLAILLLFSIKGISAGVSDSAMKYSKNQDADIFVFQKGVQNMQMTSSFFPSFVLDQISGMEGVALAEGMYGLNYQFEDKEKDLKIASYLIGFNEMGGPWKLEEGTDFPKENEVIVDFAFAKKGGFKLGEQLEIMGTPFTISGISRETNPMGGLFLFIKKTAMDSIMKSDETINLILVKLEEKQDANALIQRINREIPMVNAVGAEQLAKNEADMIGNLFDPIINAIVFIVLLVSTAFIGLTIYNATLEKLEDYTIIKAIGATKTKLFIIVFMQSFVISLTGTILGYFMFEGGVMAMYTFMPEITMKAFLGLGLSYLWIIPVMSIAAAYMPMKKILRIDEADVLRN